MEEIYNEVKLWNLASGTIDSIKIPYGESIRPANVDAGDIIPYRGSINHFSEMNDPDIFIFNGVNNPYISTLDLAT